MRAVDREREDARRTWVRGAQIAARLQAPSAPLAVHAAAVCDLGRASFRPISAGARARTRASCHLRRASF